MSKNRAISMRKILLIGLPAILALILSGSGWWLLRTSSGAAWLWDKLESGAAGTVQSIRVDGDLASGFTVWGLAYKGDGLELLIPALEVQAQPGWWPLSLQVHSLLVRDAEIIARSQQGPADETSAELDLPAMLEALTPPLPVQIHAAEFTNVTLREDDGPQIELFDSLTFRAGLGDTITVEDLGLFAAGFEVTLDGQLALEAPFDLAVALKGSVDTNELAGGAGLVLPFRLESAGSLDHSEFTFASIGQGLELGGEFLELSGSGVGSLNGLQIENMALTGPGVGLTGSAELNWSAAPRAGLMLAIQQLDLSSWLPGWPAGEKLVGELEFDLSGAGLAIPVGSLAVAGSDLRVDVDADIDIQANTVDIRLDWKNLGWPLAAAQTEYFSPSGNLTANGSLDQWTAKGEMNASMGDYPQGRLILDGNGNRTSAQLVIPEGEVLGGTVSGEAVADWENDLSWSIAVQAVGVDPEPLLPGWPGRLDGEFEIDHTDQPEKTRVNLVSMQGYIRDVRVSGKGGIVFEDDDMTFEGLEIRTDESRLHAHGVSSDESGVAFTFDGMLPTTLLQGASGKVGLEGRYSSSASSPLLLLQANALDLSWNGLGASEMALSMQLADTIEPIPSIQLEASGLSWQDMHLDAVSVTVEPAGEQHRLMVGLGAERFYLDTEMTLAPEDKREPFTKPWQGLLNELVLAIDEQYRFDLQHPAPLRWQPGSMSLGQICLRESGGANICVDGDYQASGELALQADVSAVPLDFLPSMLELNVHLEQLVEGRLEWRKLDGQPPSGGADFRITAGRIIDLEDKDVLAETQEGRFGFTLASGNLESGVFDLVFPGTGFIDLDFEVLDITGNGDKNLKGRAVTRLDDLKAIGQVVLPFVDDTDGQFESDIQLGGTLEEPVFNGGFKLSNGLVRYAPVGLKIEEIEIEGLLERLGRGSLKGSFKAGDGIASVDGRFDFGDLENIMMDAAISGDQLLLVNTDNLKIKTEADLRVATSPRRLELDGYIRVPSAKLTPANLLLEQVRDSEDLVVVGRNDIAESSTASSENKNQVFGQLEVGFGDDVFISVPGAEANISGSAVFNWTGDPVPLAQGRYLLNGKADVYGPTLEIRNGAISFPEVPANNPLLNIRAEREIYGNTQIQSAGVRVTGTLKRPVTEAFTTPVTNEDRAWTLLVTGTDFDQGQGIGGFDVGTYIAPRLYVSYGVSLFEDENVISARYDLRKGFGVKVTSGQRETGVDMSYTVDR